jgi:4-carboxymuconolactone decarboxylase
MPQYHTALMTFAAIAIGLLAQVTAAQDRLPPLPAESMTPAQKEALAEFRAARGVELFGPFIPLMRSPELMTRARAMGDFLRYRSSLPPRLSEFVILLTAREWTQQYEWTVHYPNALKAGIDPQVVQAIAEGRRPDQMSGEEATLYEFFLELHRNRNISDATYGRMVAQFGEQGVVDTVGIVGYYTLLAMMLNTSRFPLAEGVTPPLPTFPE